MTPIIRHPATGQHITAIEAYDRVMKLLDSNKDIDPKQRAKIDRYRRDLLGPAQIVGADPSYYEYTLMLNLHIDPMSWKNMPIHERCRVRAASQLKGMVELLEHHWRALEQKEREAEQKRRS
jgi:hypothetical protein